MATQERDELHRLIEHMPDDAVRDLLVIARTREAIAPGEDPMPWIGTMHEGPGFASRYRDYLWAEQSDTE